MCRRFLSPLRGSGHTRIVSLSPQLALWATTLRPLRGLTSITHCRKCFDPIETLYRVSNWYEIIGRRAKAFHPARRDKVIEGAKKTKPFSFASLCALASLREIVFLTPSMTCGEDYSSPCPAAAEGQGDEPQDKKQNPHQHCGQGFLASRLPFAGDKSPNIGGNDNGRHEKRPTQDGTQAR